MAPAGLSIALAQHLVVAVDKQQHDGEIRVFGQPLELAEERLD
jgi:hypothetical protein